MFSGQVSCSMLTVLALISLLLFCLFLDEECDGELDLTGLDDKELDSVSYPTIDSLAK